MQDEVARQAVRDPLPVPLRPPHQVMRLDRLGASHPTRLSFLRAMLRRLESEGWTFGRPVWALDARGFGHAVYTVRTPRRAYSLVAFSHDLPPEKRTDRVIAEAWDATFVLYDGAPDEDEIARLSAHAPRQEAGRYTGTDLILSRANKSVRLFEQVVSDLAAGRQPDAQAIEDVGYLMRTTAVYGNGKFGIADRDRIADREEFSGPFQAEMLTVWLIRAFTVDLAEHCSACRSPGTAVRLDPALRRRFGVGNSTGLGMAPFLVRHPVLVHRWITARETALARVRSVAVAGDPEWETFRTGLGAGRNLVAAWRTDDAVQSGRIAALREDLARLAAAADRLGSNRERLWDRIYRWAEDSLSLEGQEYCVSLLIEPYGPLVDDLCAALAADEDAYLVLDGSMSRDELLRLVDRHYGWALGIDFEESAACARFWYVSAEKLEPRLGDRHREPGAELEQPLAFAREIMFLRTALDGMTGSETVTALVLRRPDLRHVVRRIQLVARMPYAEIRDNLIAAAMRPVDLLRFKLAFFGANRFDPRSDRWLRISLFQGAPFPDEMGGASPETAMILDVSFNEVETLVVKAGRGAGLSWGLAEEAGRAARWLAGFDLPWAETLLALLAAPLDQPVAALENGDGVELSAIRGEALSPLLCGPQLVDRAQVVLTGSIRLRQVATPLWLLPFAAQASLSTGQPVQLSCGAAQALVTRRQCALRSGSRDALAADAPVDVRCSVWSGTADTWPKQAERDRAAVREDHWHALEALAARTYVPASELSRSLGAGAGDTDNE